MSHIIKCGWCGILFDTDKLEKEKWIQPNPPRGWYYHIDCWNEKQKPGAIKPDTKNKEDEFEIYRQNIFIFIERDLKGTCDYARITQQMKQYKLKNKDWTYKGMFLALKWFYEVKKNDWGKANGALGILPYIYYEGTEYWREQERRSRGITAAIVQQMKERAEKEPIVIVRKKKEKPKASFRLEDVEDDE